MSGLQRFLVELKRRNVTRVAVAYAIAGWVVVEVAATVFPLVAIPDWGATLVLMLILLGFPVALVLAWAFDLTPEGVQRTGSVEPARPAAEGGLRRGGLLFMAAVVSVAALGGYAWGRLGASSDDDATTGPIRSLAVLPLDNLTGDDDQAYFVDGMHEALISELARIDELTVLSRTSTLRYRETDRPVGEIARELGTQGIIEGSVFRSGDSVRITVQLVRGSPEEHLWAESYTGDISRALSLHSRVARAIADEIRLTLTPEEKRHLAAADSVDPRAQDAYLQGRALWRTRQLQNLEQAVALMEEAVALDPTFAKGWAGLADGRLIHTMYASTLEGWEAAEVLQGYERTRDAALHALELDPESAEANATLGYAATIANLDWEEGETRLRTALELNPSYAQGWDWLADVFKATGRATEAVTAMRTATDLDPFSPLMHRDLGFALAGAGRCPEGRSQLFRALELDSDHWVAHIGLVLCAFREDRQADAVEHLAWLFTLTSPAAAREFREVYQESGWTRALEESISRGYHPVTLSEILTLVTLNRFDEVMTHLREGYERRNAFVVFTMQTFAATEPLRDRPDFQALLREMNLAE